ncbi:MAG: hypothetical protein DPW16_09520 [Chloroflexi bacterium]|nr:hypothetical protein [Chloroflexota bacterium]
MTIIRPQRKKRLTDLFLAVIVLLLGLGIALAFLWNLTRYWGIENRGVETIGYITEVTPPRSKSNARVSFDYQVEGRTLSGHSDVDQAYYEFAQNRVGGEIPIIYFKDYPRLSAIRGFNNGKYIGVYFLAAVFFLPLGLFLMVNGVRNQSKTERSTPA